MIDWFVQLFIPFVFPFVSMVRHIRANRMDALERVRARMKNEVSLCKGLFKGWDCTTIEVPRPDGTKLQVDIRRPPGYVAGQALPLVLWFHGGGYTMGTSSDAVGATFAVELLAAEARCVWASINYRLAPEHPHPAAPNDGLLALEYLTQQTARSDAMGIDVGALHVAGCSAGGGLAAVVAAAAARRGLAIRSLFVDEPMLDPTASSASYQRNGATTVDHVSWLRWSWEAYLPGGMPSSLEDRLLVSPLAAPGGLAKTHPQTIVVTATADPLQDDGTTYADALRREGLLAAHFEVTGCHVLSLNWQRRTRRALLSRWSELLRTA